MTYDQYEHKFREKASSSGYSEEEILKCLAYAKPLIVKKVPIIFNTSNLSALVGYKKSYLKRSVQYTSYFYREFKIKKKSGKFRIIKEPLPSLKEIQTWILNNILYNIPVSRYAKAYVPNRGLIENVKYHKAKPKVLSLDIENFFPSILSENVEAIFKNLGYSSNVSNLLNKLCCLDGCLPQGAPTSPYLSNIFLVGFDRNVAEFCKKLEIRYSRYADDMIFSGTFDHDVVIDFIRHQLSALTLKLNEEKIIVMLPNQRQIVTGIVVNKLIQIPREQRDAIRKEMYYIKKFGLDNHLAKINNTHANYLSHLLGKINYALYINPADTEIKSYKDFISSMYPFVAI